eukprot:g13485.t1
MATRGQNGGGSTQGGGVPHLQRSTQGGGDGGGEGGGFEGEEHEAGGIDGGGGGGSGVLRQGAGGIVGGAGGRGGGLQGVRYEAGGGGSGWIGSGGLDAGAYGESDSGGGGGDGCSGGFHDGGYGACWGGGGGGRDFWNGGFQHREHGASRGGGDDDDGCGGFERVGYEASRAVSDRVGGGRIDGGGYEAGGGDRVGGGGIGGGGLEGGGYGDEGGIGDGSGINGGPDRLSREEWMRWQSAFGVPPRGSSQGLWMRSLLTDGVRPDWMTRAKWVQLQKMYGWRCPEDGTAICYANHPRRKRGPPRPGGGFRPDGLNCCEWTRWQSTFGVPPQGSSEGQWLRTVLMKVARPDWMARDKWIRLQKRYGWRCHKGCRHINYATRPRCKCGVPRPSGFGGGGGIGRRVQNGRVENGGYGPGGGGGGGGDLATNSLAAPYAGSSMLSSSSTLHMRGGGGAHFGEVVAASAPGLASERGRAVATSPVARMNAAEAGGGGDGFASVQGRGRAGERAELLRSGRLFGVEFGAIGDNRRTRAEAADACHTSATAAVLTADAERAAAGAEEKTGKTGGERRTWAQVVAAAEAPDRESGGGRTVVAAAVAWVNAAEAGGAPGENRTGARGPGLQGSGRFFGVALVGARGDDRRTQAAAAAAAAAACPAPAATSPLAADAERERERESKKEEERARRRRESRKRAVSKLKAMRVQVSQIQALAAWRDVVRTRKAAKERVATALQARGSGGGVWGGGVQGGGYETGGGGGGDGEPAFTAAPFAGSSNSSSSSTLHTRHGGGGVHFRTATAAAAAGLASDGVGGMAAPAVPRMNAADAGGRSNELDSAQGNGHAGARAGVEQSGRSFGVTMVGARGDNRRTWWNELMGGLLLVGVLVLGVAVLLQRPSTTPCGRSSLRAGDAPLLSGECIESEKGSRFWGFIPGIQRKSRFTVTEGGGTYSGPGGIEVPISVKTTNSGRIRRVLCRAERLTRKVVPFMDPIVEDSALVHGDSLTVGHRHFCRAHLTPAPSTPAKLLNKLRGRGGGVVQFSDVTGELEVLNRKGKVLWSADRLVVPSLDPSKPSGGHNGRSTGRSGNGAKQSSGNRRNSWGAMCGWPFMSTALVFSFMRGRVVVLVRVR